MTSATNVALQVTSDATAITATQDVVRTLDSSNRPSPACSCCRVSFDDVQPQREHMKSPWHVYNLKRRIASLPPTSRDVFDTQVRPASEHATDSPARRSTKQIEHDTASPHHCLFCHQEFDHDSQGLEDNIKHMSLAHGFFVPDITLILDLESFLTYLATEVREWHECLYCGTVRDCTTAIQSHMRDKEHCKLNLDREPELLDFWEEEKRSARVDLEQPVKPPSGALVLSSGGPGVSRASQHRLAKASRSRGTTVALRSDTTSQEPGLPPERQSCRQLARRDEMGMQNVGPQERRALVLAVTRSQKEESIASRASEWAHAKRANKQKHDQAHGPLSWAKAGLHNLLPR